MPLPMMELAKNLYFQRRGTSDSGHDSTVSLLCHVSLVDVHLAFLLAAAVLAGRDQRDIIFRSYLHGRDLPGVVGLGGQVVDNFL